MIMVIPIYKSLYNSVIFLYIIYSSKKRYMPTVRIYRARGVIERGIRGLPENIIGADLGGETIFYDAVDKNTSYDLCGFTVTAADLKVRGYEKVP